MEVKLPKELADLLGADALRKLGIEPDAYKFKSYAVLDLRRLTIEQTRELEGLIKSRPKAKGSKAVLRDIETWLTTIEKGGSPKAKDVKQFTSILTEVIARVPGHRLYKKNDLHGDAWLALYVDVVRYVQASRYVREHTEVTVVWEEFGGRSHASVSFYKENCADLAPEEALARKGLYLETPVFRKRYLEEVERFGSLVPLIGKQFLATGFGTDDVDGNGYNPDGYRDTNRFVLERDGQPSRVVIDVFEEADKKSDDEKGYQLNTTFWTEGRYRNEDSMFDGEDDDAFDGEDDDAPAAKPVKGAKEPPAIELPIHPFLACFDLRRHLRLRIHVTYLTEYVYDSGLGSKLVLPKETTDLVEMLVSHKGAFKDIISGKGGGAIVLCAGSPGTGKTLTAEVYAEVMQKPLYSVQCSQLGTDPDKLEKELLKVFSRAKRWSAICLLDEADVYANERGHSLTQNAIVGVFLRVLEYYNGVLFMTTNRAEDVDDAIASRCMARIDYAIPTPENQTRIWRILSQVMGVAVSDSTVEEVVKQHPALSGRDVKNLLKLAGLVASASGKPVTAETINFVKRFKPTVDREVA